MGQTEVIGTMKKSCLLTLIAAVVSCSALAETKTDVICAYTPSKSKAVSTVAGTVGGAGAATAAIGQALADGGCT